MVRPLVAKASQLRAVTSDTYPPSISGFGDDLDVRASYELLCHNVEQIVVEAKRAQRKLDKKVWSMEKQYIEQMKQATMNMVQKARKSTKK